MYQGTEYYLPRLGVGNGVGGGGITSEDDISLYVTIELLHNYRSIFNKHLSLHRRLERREGPRIKAGEFHSCITYNDI